MAAAPAMPPQAATAPSASVPEPAPVPGSAPTPESVPTPPVPAPEPVPASAPVPAWELASTPDPIPVPPETATPAVTEVTLTGKVTYDAVPNKTGPLDYAGTVVKPVRGASVEVVNGEGAAVGTATTGEDGEYTVAVPAGMLLRVRVEARLVHSGASSWDVSIRDNTKEDALYSMDSVAFPSGNAALKRDLHAASGWDGVSAYKGVRVAAPFAVMDTVYTAMKKVQAAAPTTQFPALRVFWSPDNRPADGSRAKGEISTSHLHKGPGSAGLYILGKEDVDTDEFDEAVIAHEWGHYYEQFLSRSDTPGGSHKEDDRLDRRVAFSEGWGNGWSGIALERSNYTDSSGPRQAQGAILILSQGLTEDPGWYREMSIQSIFWNLNAQVGFKPIHDALTSERFKARAALTSIHSFADAFNAVAPASMPVLAELLRAQKISAAPDDPFGLLETNAGTPPVANALPMHIETAVGVPTNKTCTSNEAGTRNKLGNISYFHFSVPKSGRYHLVANPTIEGTNLDINVYRGTRIPMFTSGGSKVPFVNLIAGSDYIAAVRELAGATAACFTFTVQQGN